MSVSDKGIISFSRRFRVTVLLVCVGVVLVLIAFTLFFGDAFLYMNTTSSVPVGLYVRLFRHVKVDDYVVFPFDVFRSSGVLEGDAYGYSYGVKRLAGLVRTGGAVQCFLVSDSELGWSSFDFGLVPCIDLAPVRLLW